MKLKIGPVAYMYPVPIVLAGAMVDGKPNFTTLGDCALAGIKPPLLVISSHVDHFLNQGILEQGVFSVNIPSTELLAEVDFCGMVSGRNVDKAALFEVFYGDLQQAPLIATCPVNIECRVEKECCIEHRQIFIGRVVQTHVSSEYATKQGDHIQISDLTELDPIMYALDNRYYSIGKPIGQGYQTGRKLLQSSE